MVAKTAITRIPAGCFGLVICPKATPIFTQYKPCSRKPSFHGNNQSEILSQTTSRPLAHSIQELRIVARTSQKFQTSFF
jgi:hypothetical protein